MGPMVPLSSSSAKYISFLSFILFAMYRVFTGFPAGPVCFVTSVCNARQDFQAFKALFRTSHWWSVHWNHLHCRRKRDTLRAGSMEGRHHAA